MIISIKNLHPLVWRLSSMSARSTMSVSRRRFVKGLAAGGVLLGVSAPLRHVLAPVSYTHLTLPTTPYV